MTYEKDSLLDAANKNRRQRTATASNLQKLLTGHREAVVKEANPMVKLGEWGRGIAAVANERCVPPNIEGIKEVYTKRGFRGKKANVQKTTQFKGWNLLLSTARVRPIGVLLREDGRVGIYDTAENLPRHQTTGLCQLPLREGVYASRVETAEDGIVYLDALNVLDSAGMPDPSFVPHVINQISIQHNGLTLTGIDAIRASMVDFVVDNKLA